MTYRTFFDRVLDEIEAIPVCDHCHQPVERVVIAAGGTTPREWWGVPRRDRQHSIFCDVRMGRHTVDGVPLGEKAETPCLKEGTMP